MGLRAASRPKTSPLLRRIFLGYVLAFQATLGSKASRLGAALGVMRAYLSFAMGGGAVRLDRLGRTIDMKSILAVRFDPLRKDHDALLRRYFNHTLFRKDLLLHETVAYAHNMSLMAYGFIHWYSAAFAAAADSPDVELEHLIEGLRTVEELYVFHSKFSRLFSAHPRLRGIMEGMFQRPVFAFAMARP